MNAPRRYFAEPAQLLDVRIPAVFKPIPALLDSDSRSAEPSRRERLQRELDNAIRQAEHLRRALAELDAQAIDATTTATTRSAA